MSENTKPVREIKDWFAQKTYDLPEHATLLLSVDGRPEGPVVEVSWNNNWPLAGDKAAVDTVFRATMNALQSAYQMATQRFAPPPPSPPTSSVLN